MGADIHMMAEVRLKRFKKGHDYYNKWFAVGRAFKAKQYGEVKEPPMVWSPREEYEEEAYESNKIMTNEPYDNRNYRLFALLADVRNWDGSGITPIKQPKGVPKDASKVYLKEVERWDGDGHSHSYFTYKQLVDALEVATAIEGVREDYLDLLHNLQGLYWGYKGVKEVRIVFFFDN